MTNTVLVTGGTGTLGRCVVDRVTAEGRDVVVFSRRPRPGDVARSVGWATGDLRTGDGLPGALADTTTIIHCASSSTKADVPAARRLIDAARAAGTPHLVYISIVGVDSVPLPYYRAKLGVEAMVASAGVPYTILRATQFHDLVLRLFTAQRRLPAVLVPRGLAVQPVDVAEVAHRLVDLALGEPAGWVADMGGPHIRPVHELAHAYLRSIGSSRRVASVPLPGTTMRAFRDGGNLCPERATGRTTFEEFLEERGGGPEP